MALSLRTSTPPAASICAPRARLTVRIAGSSSGLRPTARATEKSSVSTIGRPYSALIANTGTTMTNAVPMSR